MKDAFFYFVFIQESFCLKGFHCVKNVYTYTVCKEYLHGFLMSINSFVIRAFELDFSELGLSPVQALLFLTMCNLADNDGCLICLTSNLAKRCNCSRPVISSGLKKLSSLGLIEIFSSGRVGARNSYRITSSSLFNQRDLPSNDIHPKPAVSNKRSLNRKKRKAKKKK